MRGAVRGYRPGMEELEWPDGLGPEVRASAALMLVPLPCW